ncbi:MAG TPA: hypothetical protein QF753_21970 [Victivallales bacterium]|nr:hypothetical protein [Victivallales bacterium]
MTIKILKIKVNLFCLVGVLCIFAACSGGGNDAKKNLSDLESAEKKLESKMFGNLNPKNHIKDIRQYVLYGDDINLSKDEITLIQNTKPRIIKNNNKMEYCFFWVVPNGSIIEVITTPPPACDPIVANRSDRIRFP